MNPFIGRSKTPYPGGTAIPTTLLSIRPYLDADGFGTFGPTFQVAAGPYINTLPFAGVFYTQPSQYSAPFDYLLASGDAFHHLPVNTPGIYGALVLTNNITHYKATLLDSNDDVHLLFDLSVGLNPDDLPEGILTAQPVTTEIAWAVGTDAPAYNIPATGWRITFDSSVIIGSRLTWTAGLNISSGEYPAVPYGDTAHDQLALLMSPWNYTPA